MLLMPGQASASYPLIGCSGLSTDSMQDTCIRGFICNVLTSLRVLEQLPSVQDFKLVASATHTLDGYALIHDIVVTENNIIVFQVTQHLHSPRMPQLTTSQLVDLGCSCLVCTPSLLRIA